MDEPASDAPRGIDRAQVDAWLLANVPGATAPFGYDLIAAGGSNLTYRLTDAAGHQWALRRPPVGHALATAHDMHREWRIIGGPGADRGPRARVRRVLRRRRGERRAVLRHGLRRGPHPPRPCISQQALDAAAADVATDSLIDVQLAFHTVDLDAIGLGDLAKHSDYVGRQLNRWRTQVERANVRELPLMVDLHERLLATKPADRVAGPRARRLPLRQHRARRRSLRGRRARLGAVHDR